LNIEVFCYFGLLRFPEQLEPSLELLPKEQKDKATEFLASIKDLPKAELIARWSKLRQHEATALRHQYAGVSLEQLAPVVRQWCLEWLMDRNGREGSSGPGRQGGCTRCVDWGDMPDLELAFRPNGESRGSRFSGRGCAAHAAWRPVKHRPT
jgi:hypothetical protein